MAASKFSLFDTSKAHPSLSYVDYIDDFPLNILGFFHDEIFLGKTIGFSKSIFLIRRTLPLLFFSKP